MYAFILLFPPSADLNEELVKNIQFLTMSFLYCSVFSIPYGEFMDCKALNLYEPSVSDLPRCLNIHLFTLHQSHSFILCLDLITSSF